MLVILYRALEITERLYPEQLGIGGDCAHLNVPGCRRVASLELFEKTFCFPRVR